MANKENLIRYQQLQRTQELIRDVNFDNAVELPSAAGAEGANIPSPVRQSTSWQVNRIQDSISKNDMTLIATHLRAITDILDYRYRISGKKNPFYNFFENLRDQAERGEHVSWQKFTDALNTFSADTDNLDALQDEINNTGLASESRGEEAEEEEEPSGIAPASTEEQEELPLPDEQSEDSGSTDTSLPKRPPPPPQRSPAFTERTQKKLDQANKSMQETKKKLSGPEESRPQPTQSMEDKLSRTRQSMQRPPARPATETPQLSDRMSQRLSAANRSMRRTRPSRTALLNSRNRRAVLPFLRGGASSGSGLLGQALQWGLDKLAWNLARPLINTLTRGITQLLPRLGAHAARAGVQAGARLLLLPQTWVIIGIIVAVIGIIAWIYSIIDANSECGQPGRIILNKTANKEVFEIGEEIQYTITLNYNIKCTTAYLDKVIVKDTPSATITYTPGSAKSTKTMEIIDPAQISDPATDSEPGSVALPPQIDTSFPAADNISVDGSTIIWQLGRVNSNYPITMTFSATANQTDIWVPNKAIATYQMTSSSGFYSSGGGYPPTADNCNGQYNLDNPVGNFGDPQCNFKKDDLYTLLQQLDPANAYFWFYNVVRCESSYNPNSHRPHQIYPHTPDPAGAWGLYQMGRGRNGQYDHGDVEWQLQTSNAVNYSKSIPSIGGYWACAR